MRRRKSKKGAMKAAMQSGLEKGSHGVQQFIPSSDEDISVVPDSTDGLQPEVASMGVGPVP
ncbi:hypothetical protein A2U01_0091396, partial [Trifolium medium]|nr:hypothetical protein [Trifolium medium]